MTEKHSAADLGRYLLELFQRWWPLMCGVPSVPFAALAVFSDAEYSRLIWGGLAVTAAFGAGYGAWAKERAKVSQLETRLAELENLNKPKLKIEFDADDGECLKSLTPGPNTSRTLSCRYLRVRVVRTTPAGVRGCRAWLTDVKRLEGNRAVSVGFGDSVPLGWSAKSREQAFSAIDLPPSTARQYLDVLFATQQSFPDRQPDVLVIATDIALEAHAEVFVQRGEYLVTIVVEGEGTSDTISLVVSWNRAWLTLTARRPAPGEIT